MGSWSLQGIAYICVWLKISFALLAPQKATLDSLRTLSWFVSYRRLSSQFQFSLSAVTLGYLSQWYPHPPIDAPTAGIQKPVLPSHCGKPNTSMEEILNVVFSIFLVEYFLLNYWWLSFLMVRVVLTITLPILSQVFRILKLLFLKYVVVSHPGMKEWRDGTRIFPKVDSFSPFQTAGFGTSRGLMQDFFHTVNVWTCCLRRFP